MPMSLPVYICWSVRMETQRRPMTRPFFPLLHGQRPLSHELKGFGGTLHIIVSSGLNMQLSKPPPVSRAAGEGRVPARPFAKANIAEKLSPSESTFFP